MKRFFLSVGLAACFSSFLFADYQVYLNKSEPFSFSQISAKESIFFGELKEYTKTLHDIQKNMLAHGAEGLLNGLSTQSANLAKGLLQEGLKAGAAGFGMGMIIGALDPYIMSQYEDQLYVEVYKVKLNDGRTVFFNKFFVGDKHPELSKEEIKQVLGGDL